MINEKQIESQRIGYVKQSPVIIKHHYFPLKLHKRDEEYSKLFNNEVIRKVD